MLRVFRHYVPVQAILLASVEALSFFVILSLLAAQSASEGMAAGDGMTGGDGAAGLLALLTALAFTLMSAAGLYSRETFAQTQTLLARAAVGFPLLVVASSVVVLLWRGVTGSGAVPLVLPVIALALFAPLAVVMRGVLVGVVGLRAFRRRVLVIGSGRLAAKIERLARRPRHHFDAVGFVDLGGTERLVQARLSREEAFGRGLASLVREQAVDEVVVAADERRGLPVKQLLDCKLLGVRITDFASFYEREAGEVDLDELRPSWLIFSDGFRLDRGRMAVKRLFDVVVAAALLLVTLPLTLLTALAIRLDSPGPVFYRQERVGLGGARFEVLKFRSMRVDAESNGPQWARTGDSRVTRIGAFIRKTRIDEIPQVINVLKGDMSFIGPRPERPMFVADLRRQIAYYDERHRMKPGITGWAQVNYPYGASVEDARAKLAFDLYYVKNGSVFLDLIILVKTVRVILWAEGAR